MTELDAAQKDYDFFGNFVIAWLYTKIKRTKKMARGSESTLLVRILPIICHQKYSHNRVMTF